MSYTISPYQDLNGLVPIPGQSPRPAMLFFEDFLGAGVNIVSSATTGNAKFFHGGVGTETVAVGLSNFSSGHLNLQTGTTSGDSCCITTATPLATYLEGQADGAERPIRFYARFKMFHASAHVTGDAFIGMGNDDAGVPDPTADVGGASAAAGALTNFIGFSIATSTGAISTVIRTDNGSGTYAATTTTTGLTTAQNQIDATDSGYITLGFEWDGKTTCKFFVNDVLVKTHYQSDANMPVSNSFMFPVVQVKTNAASSSVLRLDWIYVLAGGPRSAS